MGSYFLLDEHQSPAEAAFGPLNGKSREYLATTPYWIVKVVRYQTPLTSSKTRLANRSSFDTGDVSQDETGFQITGTKRPLIITSSCIQMDITSSKTSYVQNLNAVLKPGRVEFLSAIMPGDWCMAWIVHSREKYRELLRKLRENEPANAFDDGLKFVGRVHDIRKTINQSPTGPRTTQYNLSCTGFSELDSSVFFDPALARKENYIARFLADMNIAMASIYTMAAEDSNGTGGISVNKVIPAFLEAFLGKGISGIGVQSGGLDLATGAAVASKEAPYSYVVPNEIANTLGVQKASKGSIYCYADILSVIQGLQKYQFEEFPQMFWPTGTLNDIARGGLRRTRHVTSFPLKGLFLPTPTSFNGKSVWNLLNEYLNPAINEMYTAVKYTPSGRIMPTLVVRQLPFSSPILNQKLGEQVTAYHELPRWVGDDLLIRGLDVGRSDGSRVNYVHIYAQPNKRTLVSNQAYQIVQWPPIADQADIKRHGLRPHMGNIQAAATDNETGGPGFWMQIKSDILLGQHMMLTGTASMVGVQAPIVPGDNFEYDGILYHIETVNHRVQIQEGGQKSFTTQLSLTHGMRADVPAAVSQFSPNREKIKGRPHQREGLIKLGEELAAGKDSKKQTGFNTRYGEDNFKQAQQEMAEGVDIEVGSQGENLDIYLYSGINAEDNRALESETTIVDTED